MKKELIEQIVPIIETTKEGLMKVVETLQERCPLLINEILWWNGLRYGFWCLIGALMLVIYWFLFKRYWEKLRSDAVIWFGSPCGGESKGGAVVVPFIIGGLICNLCGPVMFFANLTWIKILIAPRLYLLEYVGDLLNK